jgi:antitoxin (DNA-binding transcriptional repressor) of toxin-antitoxin stability system
MKISATELRQNLYRIIDAVIRTGEPVEVERRLGTVRIVPEARRSIWDSLEVHEGVAGDVEVDWSDQWDREPEIDSR